MSDVDGLRQEIAEALPFRIDQLFDGPHEWPTREDRLRTADAIVPVVTAWAEQQARERAAEELGKAGDELRRDAATLDALATQKRIEGDLMSEYAYGSQASDFTHVAARLDDRAAALADDGRA